MPHVLIRILISSTRLQTELKRTAMDYLGRSLAPDLHAPDLARIRWGSSVGQQEAQAKRMRQHTHIIPAIRTITQEYQHTLGSDPIQLHDV
jgi:hypothetical protein